MGVFLRSQAFKYVAAALLITSAALSQQPRADYTKAAPMFPNVIAPYQSRQVPPVNFSNSQRLQGLVQDGKLMLSLDDAIAAALENNLDLVIARYNLPIADTDILRTKSGAAARGVNAGIVSGTPGGGTVSVGASGGGAGGTTAGAGGVGTGTNGLVNSTLGSGPPVDSFDPVLTGSLGVQHSTTPQTNILFSGVPSLVQATGTANFGYAQGFATGTLLNITFNNSRVTTNSTRSLLVPQLNSNYLLQFRQHLLEGFSWQSNRRFIIQARNNREIADVAFRQQIIFTVTQIENMYWDLVNAYESVKAAQRAIQLANQLLADNQKQVQIGTLAPIEVVNAQAQVASSNQNLIIAQTNLQLQQLLMKNAITKNENDPVLASAEVMPTDRMDLPQSEAITPLQDLIATAMQRRTELAESRIDLNTRQVSMKAVRNAMLPALDFVANWGGTGLAGALNPSFSTAGLGGVTTGVTNTGYFDALSALNSNPTYFVGFNLNIPIRNRAAQADQIRSVLEYRQAEARLQQLQNQISIDVRNAQFTLQQNRARVDAAIKNREYAQQSLDAERKKYALGASTTYNVLTQLNNLTTAESNLVTAMAAYEQSRVAMDQVTGTTLEALGIDIGDAENGNVTHLPKVPGIVPATPEQMSTTPPPVTPVTIQPVSPAMPATGTPSPAGPPTTTPPTQQRPPVAQVANLPDTPAPQVTLLKH
ncbi:MAG TPA: TolC family protein [Terriglobales bacterium]|nr:TolC family protein [Terriglobales bacterium]